MTCYIPDINRAIFKELDIKEDPKSISTTINHQRFLSEFTTETSRFEVSGTFWPRTMDSLSRLFNPLKVTITNFKMSPLASAFEAGRQAGEEYVKDMLEHGHGDTDE